MDREPWRKMVTIKSKSHKRNNPNNPHSIVNINITIPHYSTAQHITSHHMIWRSSHKSCSSFQMIRTLHVKSCINVTGSLCFNDDDDEQHQFCRHKQKRQEWKQFDGAVFEVGVLFIPYHRINEKQKTVAFSDMPLKWTESERKSVLFFLFDCMLFFPKSLYLLDLVLFYDMANGMRKIYLLIWPKSKSAPDSKFGQMEM